MLMDMRAGGGTQHKTWKIVNHINIQIDILLRDLVTEYSSSMDERMMMIDRCCRLVSSSVDIHWPGSKITLSKKSSIWISILEVEAHFVLFDLKLPATQIIIWHHHTTTSSGYNIGITQLSGIDDGLGVKHWKVCESKRLSEICKRSLLQLLYPAN